MGWTSNQSQWNKNQNQWTSNQNQWDNNQNQWNSNQNQWNGNKNQWNSNKNQWRNDYKNQYQWNRNQNQWDSNQNQWNNGKQASSARDSNNNYYFGCYLDQDLNSFEVVFKEEDMSYQTCSEKCTQQKRIYSYFVKDKNTCYCGPSNWVAKFGKIQDSRCSPQCYQDSSQVCGNKVFTTSDSQQIFNVYRYYQQGNQGNDFQEKNGYNSNVFSNNLTNSNGSQYKQNSNYLSSQQGKQQNKKQYDGKFGRWQRKG